MDRNELERERVRERALEFDERSIVGISSMEICGAALVDSGVAPVTALFFSARARASADFDLLWIPCD